MAEINRHQELMQFLCQAPRVPGSEFGRRVMAELSSRYEKLGYRVHLQEARFEGWQLLDPGVKVQFLRPEARDVVESIPVVWSASTHGEITGVLREEGTMKTFEWYEWKKYAVVNATGTPLAYVLTRPDHVWAQPLDSSSFDRDRPYVIVGTDDCKSIEQWMEEGKSIEVSVSVQQFPMCIAGHKSVCSRFVFRKQLAYNKDLAVQVQSVQPRRARRFCL